MTKRLLLIAAILIPFLAYSLWVAFSQGYFGFLRLALAEPWAMQLLLDLGIALFLFTCWMVPDARRLRIPAWPYVLAMLALGCVGALVYLGHRELAKARTSSGVVEAAG